MTTPYPAKSLFSFAPCFYLCLGLFATVSSSALAADLNTKSKQQVNLEKQAIKIVKQFAGKLKPQLKKAMIDGGPVLAVDVCAVQAPKIASTLSTETGWQVNRVSLKPRNQNSANASDWEADILKQFESRSAAGEAVASMKHSELDEDVFRFMKPQAVEPLCLACHGQNISEEVEKVLNLHYKNDTARGYTLGDIRGAFSLSKSIN